MGIIPAIGRWKLYVRCRSIAVLMFCLGFLSSCITDFSLKNGVDTDNVLVVEGFIEEGTTEIKLSKGAGLEFAGDKPKVDDATVYVESSDGTVYNSRSSANGIYKIDIPQLDSDKEYRLRIAYEGHDYASTFMPHKQTPDIDDITFSKEGDGSPVVVEVSASGDADASRYYMWSYEDIWEYHAYWREYMPTLYYCWGYGSSNELLIGSSSGLSENKLVAYSLFTIPPKSQKLAYVYYIKLKQNNISKEAFDYFSTLKRNSENTSGLFPPVISEMKGNITCLDDNDMDVIGYVDVSTASYKEIFVDLQEYSEFVWHCPDPYVNGETGESFIPENPRYPFQQCLNCTYLGGTKIKPPFWPTANQ